MRANFSVLLSTYLILGLASASSSPEMLSNEQPINPCKDRGLVLSGGGDKGAYQAGALKALTEKLGSHQRRWKYIAGVSVGAINSMSFGMYDMNHDRDLALWVADDLWGNLKKENVLVNFVPGGVAQGFLTETGLYDTRPLRKYLSERIDMEKLKNTDRHIIVGAVALETGEFVTFNSKDADFLDGVMGSSATPFAMQAQYARGYTLLDGGVQVITPISELIESVTECNITEIDVIVNHPKETLGDYKDLKGAKTLSLGLRVIDLMENNANLRDFEKVRLKYPWVQLNIIQPAVALETSELQFTHEDTMRMIEQGYSDAVAVIDGHDPVDIHCEPKADDLTKASRSTVVTVENNSEYPLRLLSSSVEDDCWASCEDRDYFKSTPCGRIEPGKKCSFASVSCKTLRGTEGHAYYEVVGAGMEEKDVLDIYWDNPYVGKRKYTCDKSKSLICESSGTSDYHATATYTVSNQPAILTDIEMFA